MVTKEEKLQIIKKSDKSFAEFILKGLSYVSEDYFIIDPTFLEYVLMAAEDKRNLWELKDDLKKGKKV